MRLTLFHLCLAGWFCLTNLTLTAQNFPGRGKQPLGPAYIEATTEMIRGRNDRALELFQSILADHPGHTGSQYNIAKIYRQQQNMEEAERYALRAVDGEPDNYWYQILLRDIYEQRGNFSSAIEVQEKIASKSEAHPREATQLSELYRRNRQDKKALEALTDYEDQKGAQTAFADFKLELMVKLGKKEEALATLANLRQADPEYPKYYELEYDLLMEQGKVALAKQKLETLLEDDPDNGFALLQLADIYEKEGNTALAKQYMTGAFANEDIDPARKVRVMEQMMEELVQGDSEGQAQIKKLLSAFQQAHPDDAGGKSIQAQLEVIGGNSLQARASYKNALEENPADLNRWIALLENDWAGAHFVNLFTDAEEAMELYPSQTEILYYYALGATMLRMWDDADYAIKKIDRLGTMSDTEKQSLDLIKSYCAYLKGDLDEKSFESELKTSNKNDLRSIYLQTAFPLLHQKNVKSPILYKEVTLTFGSDPIWKDVAAMAAWRQGEEEEAQKLWQEALTSSESPLIAEHLGDYFFAAGDVDQAKTYWRKARSMGATFIDVQKKLTE